MKTLSQVLQDLTRHERKFIRKFLDTFLFTREGENKAVALFDLTFNNPTISHSEAAEALYGNPGSKAFSVLKRKVLDLVLNLRSLDQQLYSGKDFWKEEWISKEAEFEYKNYLGSFMRKRRQPEIASQNFQEVYAKADETWYPEQMLVASSNLIRTSPNHTAEELDQQFDVYCIASQRHQLETEVNYVTRKFKVLQEGKSMTEAGRAFLQERLPKLEQAFEAVLHPKARYAYLKLKTVFLEDKKRYKEARDAVEEMIQLSENELNARGLELKGMTWFEKMRLEMMNAQFDLAEAAGQKAIQYFSKGSPNHCITQLFMTYALIHQGKTSIAEKNLNLITPEIQKLKRPDLTINLKYHLLSLAFTQRKFSEALKGIQELEALVSHRPAIMLSLRILEMMALIEAGEFDLASYRVEAFRKYLGRGRKKERVRIIQRMLSALERNAFHFREFTKEKEWFKALRKDYPWTPAGFETIRFDHWYLHKRLPQDYTWESIYSLQEPEKVLISQ